MEKRIEELSKLRAYTEDIDKDMTMILQSLQWDRKNILQHSPLVTCRYDSNHKVLLEKLQAHEKECFLRFNGYIKEDNFLPDPLDTECSTLIKLSKEEIALIIDNASKCDPAFKKVYVDSLYGCTCLYLLLVVSSGQYAPLTLARLQATYTADERRAIHDAVVSAAPTCHDLTDLALTSTGDNDETPKTKSRTEILAELRDMRRRRTKYRVAAKSTNYSDVLRDVIKTQMEVYNEALGDTKPNVNELNAVITRPTHSEHSNSKHTKVHNEERHYREREVPRQFGGEHNRRERSDRDRRVRRQDENQSRYRKHRDGSRGRSDRDKYGERSIKIKLEDEKDETHRDRSRETRFSHRSKDRTYDDRRDIHYKHKDRSNNKQLEVDKEPYQERASRLYEGRNREDYNKERRKEKDRSRERHDDRHRDVSDAERARNLIVEIKREFESVERNEDDDRGRNDYTHTGSIEIKNKEKYKVDSQRQYERADNIHRYRHREDYLKDSDREGNYRDKRRKVMLDVREGADKHKKSKHDSRKERDRDRSCE